MILITLETQCKDYIFTLQYSVCVLLNDLIFFQILRIEIHWHSAITEAGSNYTGKTMDLHPLTVWRHSITGRRLYPLNELGKYRKKQRACPICEAARTKSYSVNEFSEDENASMLCSYKIKNE